MSWWMGVGRGGGDGRIVRGGGEGVKGFVVEVYGIYGMGNVGGCKGSEGRWIDWIDVCFVVVW